MEQLKTLEEIRRINASFPYTDPIKEWKNQGKKVIGWTCIYVPEEIIYAAGILPVRVTGDSKQLQLDVANSYLYTSTCSFMRTCFELALSNQFDFPFGKKAFPGSPFNQVELTGIIERTYRESGNTIVLLNLQNGGELIEADLGTDDKILGYTFMQNGVLPLIQKMETGIAKNLLKNLRIGDPMIVTLTVNIPADYLQSRQCNEQCKRVMKEYEKYKTDNQKLFTDAEKNIPTKVKRVGVVSKIMINQ